MNILLLEDRGGRLLELSSFLKEEGHRVYPCANVVEAKVEWEKHKPGAGGADEIHCVIVDLCMRPYGLSRPEESQKGYYTGWVFLKEFVLLNDFLEGHPNFVKRCLIVSGWRDTFMNNNSFDSPDKRAGIEDKQIISKNAIDFYGELLEALKIIEKLGDRAQ